MKLEDGAADRYCAVPPCRAVSLNGVPASLVVDLDVSFSKIGEAGTHAKGTHETDTGELTAFAKRILPNR